MIFAKRYESLIYVGKDHIIKDDICGDVDLQIRKKLVELMIEYAQPMEIHYDRYDSSKIKKSDAFVEAYNEFNKIMETPYISPDPYFLNAFGSGVYSLCLAYIFSIIELQYNNLSDQIIDDGKYYNMYNEQDESEPEISDEKNEFTKALNFFFDENDMPWRMLDGRIIKIDAQQFECDLKAKALSQIKELKDAEPQFQSAYKELTDAIEALEKGDNQSAINNAEKSYESVLKVILGTDKGNANELTQKYRDTFLQVPATMPTGGFESQVMKSLPFIRNNSGADHGAGTKKVVISKPMAKLAVNLAAALDTYLIEEYALSKASTSN